MLFIFYFGTRLALKWVCKANLSTLLVPTAIKKQLIRMAFSLERTIQNKCNAIAVKIVADDFVAQLLALNIANKKEESIII